MIFPGVGAFGSAMEALHKKELVEPLKAYIASGRPFMGICIGMQVLFEASEENPSYQGLGLLKGHVKRFTSAAKAVPHMGWNEAHACKQAETSFLNPCGPFQSQFYFVHSFAVIYDEQSGKSNDYSSLTRYGDQVFVSSIRKQNIFATQFHPEKSGAAGLTLIKAFVDYAQLKGSLMTQDSLIELQMDPSAIPDRFCKRIIACLDVRANEEGDLVVTKGDQYDVKERATVEGQAARVRNLGKPVALAQRYADEGADEVTFLNITSFRQCPLNDQPMVQVVRETSKTVFVPLTIGGGIKAFVDPTTGEQRSALDVADLYFRSGADKISIGSDAVYAAESYWQRLKKGEPALTGESAIEQIAAKYGKQAVVISIDPKRVIVASPDATEHHTIPWKDGQWCWYQCTVEGGRKARDLDVIQLAQACEALGAGELLLNCMDQDGTNSGYDLALIRIVKSAVRIPVIASSGAGCVEHFSEVFNETQVEAALAAGIFHRREVPIEAVKVHLRQKGILVRDSNSEVLKNYISNNDQVL